MTRVEMFYEKVKELSPDWLEEMEERAAIIGFDGQKTRLEADIKAYREIEVRKLAIMEFDGGLTREEAERKAIEGEVENDK